MPRNSDLVVTFLNAFMSGDTETAERLVGDDFSFRASLREGVGDRAAYFAGAKAKAKYIEDFRVLRQWEDGDDVSTLYELDIRTPQGSATVPMSEWHTVRDGKIGSTFMVFDGDAKAVHLMRDALRDRS